MPTNFDCLQKYMECTCLHPSPLTESAYVSGLALAPQSAEKGRLALPGNLFRLRPKFVPTLFMLYEPTPTKHAA